MENIKYYLVLEKRLGDYSLIDINKLDICDYNVNYDIASIDTFTSKFTDEEIKASIIRSNMVESGYLEGKLKIISDVKHNLRVLTKNVFNTVIDFQNNNEVMNPDFKNKIYGIYKKIVESNFNDPDFINRMLERFKIALKNKDKNNIFSLIAELPYSKSRNIYFGIYDEEEKQKQEMLRNLKKVNEAA